MSSDHPELLVPPNFFAKALCFELALGVIAIAIGFVLGHDPLAPVSAATQISFRSIARSIGWGIAAAIPLVIGLGIVDRYPFGPLLPLKDLTKRFIVPLFAGQQLWQLLLVSVAAGFGEETFFRGLVQAGLDAKLAIPTLVAWIIASVSFGICHWLSTTYAVLAMLIGLYLGGLYWMTDSLVAPIVTHGLYDFVALVYLTKWWPRLEPRDDQTGEMESTTES